MRGPLRPFLASACAAFLSALPTAAQQLKVYVLCGQSNMQGHAKVHTFDYLADDPATRPLLEKMRDERGQPTVCDDVWIAYRSAGPGGDAETSGRLTAGFGARRDIGRSDDKIGPEFTFGLRAAEAHDGPVLLIKTAWGGKSLHTDFRPPSAGEYEFTERQLEQFAKQGKDVAKLRADKREATGRYYRSTIEYVKQVLADPKRYCPDYDEHRGYELCGFVWFQGWNDMVDRGTYPERDQPGGYAQYTECLQHLIRDVRRDLGVARLPFVIGVMGVGGPIAPGEARAVHQNFRDAMAAPASLPEFSADVIAVETAPYWEQRLDEIARRISKVDQMARMLRNKHPKGPNADGEMSAEQQREYLARYRAEVVGEADDATFRRGASNGGYHYLGCAKTMARIGVAFAEALLER